MATEKCVVPTSANCGRCGAPKQLRFVDLDGSETLPPIAAAATAGETPVLRRPFYFAEFAAGNVEDEAADGEGLADPTVGFEFLQLLANVGFDVLKSVEADRRTGRKAGLAFDLPVHFFF